MALNNVPRTPGRTIAGLRNMGAGFPPDTPLLPTGANSEGYEPIVIAQGGRERPMSSARKGVRLVASAVGLLLVLSGCTAGPTPPFYHPGLYHDEYNVPEGGS